MGLQAASLQGRRILVVEDDYLVALALIGILEQAGAWVLGPIGTLDEAIVVVENDGKSFDVAILDIDLHGRKSYPVADALAARAVKVVFTTGYDASVIEGKYRQYPRCEKPCNADALVAAVAVAVKS
jgi:DNA-binding LytR/AlgR family response regulator